MVQEIRVMALKSVGAGGDKQSRIVRSLFVVLMLELTTDETKMRLGRFELIPIVSIFDVVVKGEFVDTVAKLPREHLEECLAIPVNGGRPTRVGWRRHGSQSWHGGLEGGSRDW
jgi:hypothetical protein